MMLRRLWRSTSGLVALVALAFAGATVLIGVIAYEVTHEALERQLDHRVAVETRVLLGELSEGGHAEMIAALRQRSAIRTGSSLEYLARDAAGRPIVGTMTPLTPPAPGYEEFFRFRRAGYVGVGQAMTTAVPGGTLTVVADRRELNEIDATLERLFALAFAAMLILGVTAAASIGWLTHRRLAHIDDTALAIIGGDLTQRVPRDGSDSEFDRLAATLNRMLDRVAMLMDNLRQVSSDVAHDLRTPLTRLSGQLDRAASGATAQERDSAIDAARLQADDLLETFAAILRIAEVEGLKGGRALTRVDLSLLAEDLAETYRPDLETSGRLLEVDIAAGLHINGDRRLLAQALSNLLENALRHSPTPGAVRLRVATTGQQVTIDVIDDGPGMPVIAAERLFTRFARSELSRSTPGHGLGLALVRAVAEAHAGSAKMLPPPGFGVRLIIPALP